VSRRIDSPRHPAHHGHRSPSQAPRQRPGHLDSIRRRPARADYRHRLIGEQRLSPLDAPADVQHRRRRRQLGQRRRVSRVAAADHRQAGDGAPGASPNRIKAAPLAQQLGSPASPHRSDQILVVELEQARDPPAYRVEVAGETVEQPCPAQAPVARGHGINATSAPVR